MQTKRKNVEHRVANVRLDVKMIGEEGEFEGYASVFETLDSYGDRVKSGAFQESLMRRKPNEIAMLWQHNANEVIGVWTGFMEDERGLRCTGKLIRETQRGAEAYALMKEGAIQGLSIGFIVEESREAQDGAREIVRVDLWEVSVVTFPANPDANVMGVRHALATGQEVTKRDMEHALKELGLSRRQAQRFIADGFDAMIAERDAGDQHDDTERDAEVERENRAAIAALIETLTT
jgi:HK97 family phage prohead protease